MAALAATNSATPSLQSSLIRNRLQAARREADQAQANVQTLRAQVDAAETTSQQTQGKVRSLTSQASQSSQTDPTYKAAVQASQSAVPVKTQELLFGLYDATSSRRQASGNGLKNNPDAAPVLNTQGQATGRIVNMSA
ncbi:MAG: hypothetical protein PHQ58_01495 [Rhodoferax sp.]|uniref:hypothetical protein n=1 Tax=Rhodoferax sp. TaxID=50421 RepID=UPI002623945C|nr:hypothetical protein [Rhodoferax sp.]MDD2879085.1 hypothetical protein [Rhodoferax sp.]